MRLQLLISSLASSAGLFLSASTVHANSASSVQDFATQMGSWNVITSGAFSTDSHVHGTVAVGGSATLSGNADINSHGSGNAEALRVYGNLNLIGNTTVLSGGATVVKNRSTNTNISLLQGQPNANQSTIVDNRSGGRLLFAGNGGSGAPTLKSISKADNFFTSRDPVMQAANTQLLSAGTFAPTIVSSNTLSFNATAAGVSVFNWDIDQLTSISHVGFNFGTDSFIVVNIIGDTARSTWNASFNVLGGSDYLTQHLLWNIGVSTVNFTGDQLLGSILAPDSRINSHKQLNGEIYAGSLNQDDQEIHYTPLAVTVPEEPSTLVLAFAAIAMGAALWARRFFRASAQ
jgi:choice-of-anchor A domain-containing protein